MAVTAQVELIRDCLDEMKPYFPVHWEELALYKDKMPLDPDYDLYLRREEEGAVSCVTLRENGVLCGYWISFISNGVHYKSTLTATMDILYVAPEHRGNKSGFILADKVKSELKRRGVKMWWAGSKNHKQIEWFLSLLDFEQAETYFCQWIGD